MLLTIDKLVYGGDGLSRLAADENGPGKAVFVPFVLEGEKVEVALVEQKRSFARARVEKVVESSQLRVDAICPYFGRCGGCHYQHTGYQHQLEIKTAILKENLRRIGKIELDSSSVLHFSHEWNYRNRTRLKVQSAPEFAVGYYKANSHELLPIEQCPISSPLINQAIAALWREGRDKNLGEEIQEVELSVNADDSQLLLEVYGNIKSRESKQLSDTLMSTLPALSGITFFKASAPTHPGELKKIESIGVAEITYKTRSASYRVSAGSFFQVNRYLIDVLTDIVTGGSMGETALDLYAGVGLFTCVLAKNFAQVIGVESSPTSHSDLLYNSPANVKAVRSTTEQFLQRSSAALRPNLVVVDPPRNGLGETVVRSLAGLGASRIVYVSCEPATASRDLAGLLSSGYRIQQAHVVDLFPQTFHIETVWHLVR